MIALLVALLAAAYYWAKETDLDLITRGEGRLIAEGQNKLVQSPEGGVVSEIFVDEGDIVKKDQLIALINSTAAEGSLEEVLAKRNSLAAKLLRLDAELQNSSQKELNRSPDAFVAIPPIFVTISTGLRPTLPESLSFASSLSKFG